MKNLYLIGAGGCGREVYNMILDSPEFMSQWNIIGFLDDTEDPLKGKECGLKVVGSIEDFIPSGQDELLMCIAEPTAKKRLVSKLKNRGCKFASYISPWASLGRYNSLGEGVIIYGGFSMSVNVRLGSFVTLLSSGLGHDVEVGDFSTIAGDCSILGHAKIGQEVFLGNNVKVAPHITIGDQARVNIGSVVVRDVKPGAVMFGNPAREIS